MKVRFFYDTNNNFLHLCRELQKFKIDAKVISKFSIEPPEVYRVYDGVLKESDYNLFDFRAIQDSEIFNDPFRMEKEKVRNCLLNYIDEETITVGSWIAPGVFNYADVKLDVFLAVGDDLRDMPFMKWYKDYQKIKRSYNFSILNTIKKKLKEEVSERPKNWPSWIKKFPKILKCTLISGNQSLKILRNIVKFQKKGICQSTIVVPDNSYISTWVNLINEISWVKLQIPLASDSDEKRKSIFTELLIEIRKNSDFIIISTNKNYEPYGTQYLIEGYIKFTQKISIDSVLILSSRGDLQWATKYCSEEFKKLVEKGKIFLLPCVALNELKFFFDIADVAFGKIPIENTHYSSTIAQILNSGIPMINNIKDEYEKTIDNKYPYVKVKTSSEVANSLEELYCNPKLRKKLGEESKKWYKDFSSVWTREWIDFLKSLAKSKN